MRIVIDDAADVPNGLAVELGIKIVPVNIAFGVEEYLSGVTMDHAAFYEKVKQVSTQNFPKTSQPTPYQFVQAYQELLDAGETEILTITISQKLSGTYASAVAAIQELSGRATFHLFDSTGAAAAQGLQAVEAARMAQAGQSIDRILKRLEYMRDGMTAVFTIDSLEFAVRGGRVSFMKSAMASLLNLKPILELKDGLITEAGRVRTRRKALAYIVEAVKERVGDRPVKISIAHANARAEALQLLDMARASLNHTEVSVTDMAVAVAINVGPGALGVIAVPD